MVEVSKVLNNLRAEVPGLMGALVGNLNGACIGHSRLDLDEDPQLACEALSQAFLGHLNALLWMGMDDGNLEEIIYTGHEVLVLVRMLGAEHFLVLRMKRDANMGIARMAMRRLEPGLVSLIALSEDV